MHIKSLFFFFKHNKLLFLNKNVYAYIGTHTRE